MRPTRVLSMLDNKLVQGLRNVPKYKRIAQKVAWTTQNMADTVVDAATGRTFYSHMYHDPQPQTIMHLADENDLNNISLACDSDYGGASRIDLDISPDRGDGSERWVICKGRMSLAVRKEVRGKIRSGWVGFRTLKAAADPLWFDSTRDIGHLTHLSVLVRPKGDPWLWPHWFVNLRSASTFWEGDLHTHRLGVTGSGALGDGWEECLIPLSDLVHLENGHLHPRQYLPDLSRMTTVGFSLLGAPRLSHDRRTQKEAYLNPELSPFGIEGNFHMEFGPVRAIYQDTHFRANALPPTYRIPPSLAYFQAQISPPPPTPPTLYPSFKDAYYRNGTQATFERGSYPPYYDLPGVHNARPTEHHAQDSSHLEDDEGEGGGFRGWSDRMEPTVEEDERMRRKEDAMGATRIEMDPRKEAFGKEVPRRVRKERKVRMEGLGAEEARKALEDL